MGELCGIAAHEVNTGKSFTVTEQLNLEDEALLFPNKAHLFKCYSLCAVLIERSDLQTNY